ncbi:hypothetical protein, partial [Salmonella sp. s60732]|uniref:hypothetical protein n=1 Tax=Salmonella sp. s60732 TaxID=3160132 RepID=UPI003754A139
IIPDSVSYTGISKNGIHSIEMRVHYSSFQILRLLEGTPVTISIYLPTYLGMHSRNRCHLQQSVLVLFFLNTYIIFSAGLEVRREDPFCQNIFLIETKLNQTLEVSAVQ